MFRAPLFKEKKERSYVVGLLVVQPTNLKVNTHQ